MSRNAMVVAALIAFVAATQAAAQTSKSVYTKSALNTLKANNSTANYSAKQLRSNIYNRTVPRYAFTNQNRGLFNSSLGTSQAQKPFSSLGGRGGVSPYLGLSAPFSSTAEQYYTQVRPQLQQQRINQQMAQRNAQLQHQLNSIAAQPPYDPQGSERMAPTGHVAVFQNRAGYYPEPQAKR